LTRIVDRLDLPSQAERDVVKAGPVALDAFQSAFKSFRCLDQIELRPPPAPPKSAPESARIVFWNAERLKYLDPSVALLGRLAADAILICEVDHGMARSGNRHRIAELAEALDAGYLYGAEFVELDLGDARERRWHAGATNAAGLHGAGIVSSHPLLAPELVRLERSGRWFDGAFGERRVGGRIATMAELELVAGPVLLASVHYESHTGPEDRLAQTCVMLDAIDRHDPRMPVLIGGDFNTSTFEVPISRQPDIVARALNEDSVRLVLPMRYEPMFEELKARGYDWEGCNRMGAITQRTRSDGTPPPPFGRIDWLFARGLQCGDAAVIPAVDGAGAAISDHDALAVTIRVRRR
jgi:endonuclease/exonuclease/phosphatase family metal-dependent hydrolase